MAVQVVVVVVVVGVVVVWRLVRRVVLPLVEEATPVGALVVGALVVGALVVVVVGQEEVMVALLKQDTLCIDTFRAHQTGKILFVA